MTEERNSMTVLTEPREIDSYVHPKLCQAVSATPTEYIDEVLRQVSVNAMSGDVPAVRWLEDNGFLHINALKKRGS